MEAFSALLVLCVGNSLVTSEFSSQRASNADFDVSLIRVCTSCSTIETTWRSCDVIVMYWVYPGHEPTCFEYIQVRDLQLVFISLYLGTTQRTLFIIREKTCEIRLTCAWCGNNKTCFYAQTNKSFNPMVDATCLWKIRPCRLVVITGTNSPAPCRIIQVTTTYLMFLCH